MTHLLSRPCPFLRCHCWGSEHHSGRSRQALWVIPAQPNSSCQSNSTSTSCTQAYTLRHNGNGGGFISEQQETSGRMKEGWVGGCHDKSQRRVVVVNAAQQWRPIYRKRMPYCVCSRRLDRYFYHLKQFRFVEVKLNTTSIVDCPGESSLVELSKWEKGLRNPST